MANFPVNTPQITVREIPAHNLTLTADQTGTIYVNGIRTSRPITAQGLTFVWAPKETGLPKLTKLALSDDQVTAVQQHSGPYRAWQADLAMRERAFDDAHNEGGEGYNPHR